MRQVNYSNLEMEKLLIRDAQKICNISEEDMKGLIAELDYHRLGVEVKFKEKSPKLKSYNTTIEKAIQSNPNIDLTPISMSNLVEQENNEDIEEYEQLAEIAPNSEQVEECENGEEEEYDDSEYIEEEEITPIFVGGLELLQDSFRNNYKVEILYAKENEISSRVICVAGFLEREDEILVSANCFATLKNGEFIETPTPVHRYFKSSNIIIARRHLE